jgi:uncharacterized protein (TIGR03000 family)
MRMLLLLAAIAGIATTTWPGDTSAGCYYNYPPAASATIVVNVPADAKLYFDGYPTVSTGTIRFFQTPPLLVGNDFIYTLQAQVAGKGSDTSADKEPDDPSTDPKDSDLKPRSDKVDDGQPVTVTKKILVRADHITHIDFGDMVLDPKPKKPPEE